MPIYEYECKECLHRFEEWAKMEDPFPVCPECKGEVERIISLTGVGKVEMNSRELLEKVKDKYPETIRIILSGYADVSVILEAINKGEIYRFIGKPWNDEELKSSIKQCIEHYDIVQENKMLLLKINEQNETLSILNNELEQILKARTKALELSQELLEYMPIPIFGFDTDLKLIITNFSLREKYPEVLPILPGTHIRDFFPITLVTKIENVIKENKTVINIKENIFNKSVSLTIKYIPKRGILLIIE